MAALKYFSSFLFLFATLFVHILSSASDAATIHIIPGGYKQIEVTEYVEEVGKFAVAVQNLKFGWFKLKYEGVVSAEVKVKGGFVYRLDISVTVLPEVVVREYQAVVTTGLPRPDSAPPRLEAFVPISSDE